MKFYPILLSRLIFEGFVSANPRISPQTHRRETSTPLPTLFSALSRPDLFENLDKRQMTSRVVTSICGFESGDPSKPRSANPGFDCRVNTDNGLWGFCLTTISLASDCGLAGYCFDGSECSDGCGILGVSGITTITCNAPGQDFCSTAWLIEGPDQTYGYIACGPNSSTQLLLAEPTATSTAASSTASSRSNTASSTTAISTPSTSVPSSSISASSVLSQSILTASSSSQSAVPNPFSNTSTLSESSKSNVGAIVGGVLGGLALIGFFVLAAIFLLRKHQRNLGSSDARPQQAAQEAARDDPKMLAGKDTSVRQSKNQGNGGSGPSELSIRQEEPAELGG